ncbi:ubiquitin carboxyl-terminal hydrolase [Aphelenchoides avenae]|nr:ubiquitin carboxyl-terminal hydrolase [Aphelenchus avenae]
MTWSISAHRRLTSGLFDPVEKYGLGFFLKCHGPPADPAWRRDAYALMRIVAQEPGVDDHCRAIGHTFKPSEIDWGYSQFTSFDRLLDAKNGFLVEDKYVELVVDVFTKDGAPSSVVASCTATYFD